MSSFREHPGGHGIAVANRAEHGVANGIVVDVPDIVAAHREDGAVRGGIFRCGFKTCPGRTAVAAGTHFSVLGQQGATIIASFAYLLDSKLRKNFASPV